MRLVRECTARRRDPPRIEEGIGLASLRSIGEGQGITIGSTGAAGGAVSVIKLGLPRPG